MVVLVPPGMYPEKRKALVFTPCVIAPYSFVWKWELEERIVNKKHMLSHNDRNAPTKMLVYLVLEAFRSCLCVLSDVRQSKLGLISPIQYGVHTVIVMCTMAAAIHVHTSF